MTKKEKLLLFRLLKQIIAKQDGVIKMDFGISKDLEDKIKELS